MSSFSPIFGTAQVLKQLKNNFNANSEPTSSNDINEKYEIGSLWIYGSSVYICVDNTAGAAIWKTIAINHQWSGTELRLQNPDGTWGNYVDLKGDSLTAEFSGTELIIRNAETNTILTQQDLKGDSLTALFEGYELVIKNADTNTEITRYNVRGEKGDEPAHEISGMQIRFKNPDGTWGDWLTITPQTIDKAGNDIQLKDGSGNILSVITLNLASSTTDGLMSKEDKSKINNISDNATETTATAYSSGFNKFSIDGIDALTGSEIVEEGSNVNGNYIKYENGLMICWVYPSITSGSSIASEVSVISTQVLKGLKWTFPLIFLNKPFVTGNTNISGYGKEISVTMAESYGINNVYVDYYISAFDSFDYTDLVELKLFSIGRWK